MIVIPKKNGSIEVTAVYSCRLIAVAPSIHPYYTNCHSAACAVAPWDGKLITRS